jgi:hypothetical protein
MSAGSNASCKHAKPITQDLLLLLLAAGFSIIASPVEEKKEKTQSDGQTQSEDGSAAGETEAVIAFKDGSSMTRLAAACDSLRRALARVSFGAAGQQEVQ